MLTICNSLKLGSFHADIGEKESASKVTSVHSAMIFPLEFLFFIYTRSFVWYARLIIWPSFHTTNFASACPGLVIHDYGCNIYHLASLRRSLHMSLILERVHCWTLRVFHFPFAQAWVCFVAVTENSGVFVWFIRVWYCLIWFCITARNFCKHHIYTYTYHPRALGRVEWKLNCILAAIEHHGAWLHAWNRSKLMFYTKYYALVKIEGILQ